MSASYSMMIDYRTGALTFRGTNGRTYTHEEFLAADAAAKLGDEDAKATLAAIQRPPSTSREEAQARLQADMDDCELCREARASGEQPIFVSHDGQIDGWYPPISREPDPRPPDWWHGRRPKRRGRR